ncbi:hypothetical protein OBBRIDRAFT_808623 [Obba rivulosa]|uniref:Uncharacterized protein n=1 Tax=Obba rivulosa TaxID=1052685 RepID=A0A8E2ANM9_9APHY|nr:hypothetical protein OBBRIDRAFT_808623 [Obba rivulosa]
MISQAPVLLRWAQDIQLKDVKASESKRSWQIPPGVDKNLNKYAIRLLLSPNLAHYNNDSVVKILMGITKCKLWGLSPTIRMDDDGKWDWLEARAHELLSQHKSKIKKLISYAHHKKSVGNKDWHIVELCQHLIDIGIKSVKTNLVVTKAMCVRIAFLCQVLSDHGNNTNYWPNVNNELEKVHAITCQKCLAHDMIKPSKEMRQTATLQDGGETQTKLHISERSPLPLAFHSRSHDEWEGEWKG